MPTRTSIVLGWLVVFGAAFALFLFVALLAWWQRRRLEPPRAKRDAERAEWADHAAAVARRSAQAAEHLAAARAWVARAEQERGQAWQAVEETQRAYEQAHRAHQEASRRHHERSADRTGQREVANAALAAYRRGDITHEQLLRVWRWGSGWDPDLERRERALQQARAGRREAHLRYQAAANAESTASQQAAVAEAAARALAEEVAFAAQEAGGIPERPAPQHPPEPGVTGWR